MKTLNLSHVYFSGTDETLPGKPRPPAFTSPVRCLDSFRSPPVLTSSRVSHRVPQEPLDPFLRWLLQQGGISPEDYRTTALQRRLPACLRKLRVRSPESARSLLQNRPDLIPATLNTVLIGVTEFFRDSQVFDQLETRVLPALLQDKTGLRVLAAGVSCGQELYSVAMLLDLAGALARSRLLGVDCRPDAITRACAGMYTAREMDGLAPRFQHRFFTLHEHTWRIIPRLRQKAEWRIADLRLCSSGQWDLILFRNVAIYLDEPAAAALWQQFTNQLAPGGVLMTGKSERPPQHLPLLRLGPSLYQLKP